MTTIAELQHAYRSGALSPETVADRFIAADPAAHAVIFVEVNTRTGDRYGGLAYAVPDQKVRRLRRLAGIWLACQETHWPQVRLDVIGVRVGRSPTPEITHLQGVGA